MSKHGYEYDLIVIGSGPGGYVAAIRAAQLGLKTACIEKHKTLGGTCLNVGCIPSKSLLQSSEAYAWMLHEAEEHGISFENPTFNLEKMMQRKSAVVSSLVGGIAGLFKRNQVAHIEGNARFTSPNALEISEGKNQNKRQVSAANFIIATGSESIPLPFLPFEENKVVSSTGALSLQGVPPKMVVIGGGVIGLELASVYSRLGSKVTVVEMLDRIGAGMDAAISKALLHVLKKQGIAFYLKSAVTKAEKNGDSYVIHVKPQNLPDPEAKRSEVNAPEVELQADVVLVAVGRRPFSAGLGLKELKVDLTGRGFVKVDGNFRTNFSHIYAIGDLIEGPMLAHRASEEGAACAEIIAGQSPHVNYLTIPNVIYTNPEVAAVGLTEEEARDMQLSVVVGTCLFKGNPRARCIGNTDGLVKVIAMANSGQLIGVHILGLHASEMIGEAVIALQKKCTLEEIANASHAHPTCAEAIKEACLVALGRAIHV